MGAVNPDRTFIYAELGKDHYLTLTNVAKTDSKLSKIKFKNAHEFSKLSNFQLKNYNFIWIKAESSSDLIPVLINQKALKSLLGVKKSSHIPAALTNVQNEQELIEIIREKKGNEAVLSLQNYKQSQGKNTTVYYKQVNCAVRFLKIEKINERLSELMEVRKYHRIFQNHEPNIEKQQEIENNIREVDHEIAKLADEKENLKLELLNISPNALNTNIDGYLLAFGIIK